jgi:hypothetical protein
LVNAALVRGAAPRYFGRSSISTERDAKLGGMGADAGEAPVRSRVNSVDAGCAAGCAVHRQQTKTRDKRIIDGNPDNK